MSQVDRVSSDWGSTHTAMCLLDVGVELCDATGPAPDILVVAHAPSSTNPPRTWAKMAFLSSHVHKAYLATAFTRNPSLVVPGQQHALLAVALVRSIVQLCDEGSCTPQHISNTLDILFTLRCYLFACSSSRPYRCAQHKHPILGRPVTERNSFDFACVTGLLGAAPGPLLTEAHEEMQSMCRVLATMCAVPELLRVASFFSVSNERARVEACLALLAESVSRDVRIKIRSGDSATAASRSELLVQEVLGIDDSTCSPQGNPPQFSDAYDFDVALVNLSVILFFFLSLFFQPLSHIHFLIEFRANRGGSFLSRGQTAHHVPSWRA
jgi:hypothetical protein